MANLTKTVSDWVDNTVKSLKVKKAQEEAAQNEADRAGVSSKAKADEAWNKGVDARMDEANAYNGWNEDGTGGGQTPELKAKRLEDARQERRDSKALLRPKVAGTAAKAGY